MNISFFEVMPGEEQNIIPQLPTGHAAQFFQEKLTIETAHLAEGAEIISVFVHCELRAPLLDKLSSVKLIATRSMGFDHIDVPYARSKGIAVVNVTTYAAHPVAEFTFALLLSVTRKIYPAYHQLREGMDFDIKGLGGFNLYGKTIGIIGTGRIGRNVASIARGFGMRVLACDARPDEALAAEQGFQYVSLQQLASEADIISVHVPYAPESHHLLNAELFAHMKKGVVIINTARGEIIDTHALIDSLQNGTVWGAGLDVLEEERAFREERGMLSGSAEGVDYKLLAANHMLVDMPNVIVTPHIAFETTEAMREIERVTTASISDFIAGKQIISL